MWSTVSKALCGSTKITPVGYPFSKLVYISSLDYGIHLMVECYRLYMKKNIEQTICATFQANYSMFDIQFQLFIMLCISSLCIVYTGYFSYILYFIYAYISETNVVLTLDKTGPKSLNIYHWPELSQPTGPGQP